MKNVVKNLFKDGSGEPTRFSLEEFVTGLDAQMKSHQSIASLGTNLVKSVGLESFGQVSAEEKREAQQLYKSLDGLLTQAGFEAHFDKVKGATPSQQRVSDNLSLIHI